MIQRIQSLYLSSAVLAMIFFLGTPLWEKVAFDHLCTIKSYALLIDTDQKVLFPYGLAVLLASYLIFSAVYTIIRSDDRRLQVRLIVRMNLLLVLLLIFIFFLVKKTNALYLPGGYGTYKLGIVLPFIAVIVNLLAKYYIQKDEQLVNDNHLR